MSYIDKRPKTIFCDIDGTLVKHNPPIEPGTLDTILEWDRRGYNIILTTGRRESMREVTEKQLSEVGIIYDQLIMGIKGGPRYLINDKKPDGKDNYAVAINLKRNVGIQNINI